MYPSFFALSATLLIPLEAWLLLKIHRNITFAEMNELEYIMFVFIQNKIPHVISTDDLARHSMNCDITNFKQL